MVVARGPGRGSRAVSRVQSRGAANENRRGRGRGRVVSDSDNINISEVQGGRGGVIRGNLARGNTRTRFTTLTRGKHLSDVCLEFHL